MSHCERKSYVAVCHQLSRADKTTCRLLSLNDRNISVNRQNLRFWCSANSGNVYERPLHSLRVTVWSAVREIEIIAPYFFIGQR